MESHSNLELLREIASLVNRSGDTTEALGGVLGAICRQLSFRLGQAFVREKSCDLPRTFHVEGEDPASCVGFRVQSLSAAALDEADPVRRARREELPRIVSAEAMESLPGPRMTAARSCGLQVGVAVPVVGHGRVLAVLEFWRDWEQSVDQATLDLLLEAARELAQVFLRARQMAEVVERSERMVRQTFDSAPDAMFLHDLEGRIVDVNESACILLGYQRCELVGMNVSQIELEIEGKQGGSEYWRDMRTGEYRSVQGFHRRWDGSSFPVDVRLSLVERDRPLVLAIARDQSERRSWAEALCAAKESAENEARAKTRFLATMSHEIRTQLNGVIGAAEMLPERDLSAATREHVAILRGASQSLLAIVNDILDIAKIEAGKFMIEDVPFDLHELLREIAATTATSAEAKGLELGLEGLEDLPVGVRSDPVRLRQVLMNFLTNAVKFTAEGEVVLRAERIEVEGRRVFRFSVRDTGIGIAPDDLGRLFDSFTQASADTARKFGGTGLGLTICKQLVELMGGWIGVESDGENGSCFWCELPLSVVDLPRRRESDRSSDELLPCRVLLAEDNPVNQKIARRMLESMGCAVQVANDGLEAVELLVQAEQPYDLVLMDCQMPRMDGFAATAEIRAMDGPVAGIPIVALTADVSQEAREHCLQAGMDEHLGKPVTRAVLREVVGRRAATQSDAVGRSG